MQFFQKYTSINGSCQNEWGLVSTVTQQLGKLNPEQMLTYIHPSDDQFQNLYLIFQHGLDDAQNK